MSINYPLAWPLDTKGKPIRPKQISLSVAQVSRSGGQGYTGVEQVVVSPGMRWEGKLSFPQMDRTTLLNWRGFTAAMQGRVGSVLMPIFEAGRQPWPADQYGRLQTPSLARDPRLVETQFEIDPAKDAAADIIVTASAADANSTSIVLQANQSGPIYAGHRFSIGQSLYEIMQATLSSPGVYGVIVRPWLRVAIADGTVCEFRNPVCGVRFKTDNEGSLDLDVGRFANPEINVVEAF